MPRELPGRARRAPHRRAGKHTQRRQPRHEAAIELHFNSAGPPARGHEWVHWHCSAAARALAEKIDYEMRLQIPPNVLPVRGLKPKSPGDRGAEFLRLTHCPTTGTLPPPQGQDRPGHRQRNRRLGGLGKSGVKGYAPRPAVGFWFPAAGHHNPTVTRRVTD